MKTANGGIRQLPNLCKMFWKTRFFDTIAASNIVKP